ncbi:MAG TPA: hypothetical protein VFA07_08920 [Chthonomonadaceae bacterium]|nr:hypothetical protein [Chthonomonadaceae bacterium]
MKGAPSLIWDACTLLNLVATRRASEILTVLGCPSFIVKQVREKEILYLRPLPDADPPERLIPVDLTPLQDMGALQDVELTAAEQATFVTFAVEMDDGEARSAAVAAHRGWWLVTDDRVSLRVARKHSTPIHTVTTPEWVRYWSEEASVDDTTLAQTLNRSQICANYIPRRVHPLRGWWDTHLS